MQSPEDIGRHSVQDKNPVTQVSRNAKPGLQGFCPAPRGRQYASVCNCPLNARKLKLLRSPKSFTMQLFHREESNEGGDSSITSCRTIKIGLFTAVSSFSPEKAYSAS